MRSSVTATCVLALVFGVVATAEAASWKIDESHTTVGFSVSHLFTSVQGRFDRFDGAIEFDPEKPEAAVVRATVEAASINTNNEKRDKHLRSGDFFDVETYPTLSFESTSGVMGTGTRCSRRAGCWSAKRWKFESTSRESSATDAAAELDAAIPPHRTRPPNQ
jgi:polyisoprenoid-binding protein YceI